MPVTLLPVRSKKDLRRFVTFTFKLYKNDPYWVPPLIRSEMNILSPDWNPAFETSEVQLWIAQHNGEDVGRVAAILNQTETVFFNKKIVRFGWFDFIDDPRVSSALIREVENWAK